LARIEPRAGGQRSAALSVCLEVQIDRPTQFQPLGADADGAVLEAARTVKQK
jgi:hypothetical protein